MTLPAPDAETFEAIHRLLRDSWDPLDLKPRGLYQNQYLPYAKGVIELLRSGGTAAELAGYLHRGEVTLAGWAISSGEERSTAVERLWLLWHGRRP